MAMFPIFMVGLIAGGILGYVFSIYKKETPSETKFRIMEAEIIALKNDKEMLEKLTDKQYKKLEELKKEVLAKSYKNSIKE